MTLSEIRKKLVQVSGRYDLVVDGEDYKDDGANFYIQAGQRLLDSMFTHSKSMGKAVIEVKTGTYVYNTPGLLAIEGVQILTDDGRVTLNHVEEQDLLDAITDETVSDGTPVEYAIYTSPLANLGDGTTQELKGLSIALAPTPDKSYEVEVFGRISSQLKEDEDSTFWTINYPETLISAALYQIERFHRNTQGMNDYMNSILRDLRELDANAIESQIGSINQMKDSFKFRGEGNEW